YSDRLAKEVKLASKNKTVHAPVEKPFDMSNSGGTSNDTADNSETSAEITEKKDSSEDEFVEIAQLSEKIEKNSARNVVSESPKVPQVEGTVVSSDNIKVKPFTPQAFDSVFDAMQAGNGGEDGESPKKKEKPVEIKKPKWERISREDAFKDKDEE
ncbi:MAG: hypothetical protein K2J72_04750, partial [Oscillospiraceae bacterium]|nr:hypothetical protein [Oscillospiraceae bacterium]